MRVRALATAELTAAVPCEPIALRPHHLLCMLTFAGYGYTPAYTAEIQRIVRTVAEGTPVRIVEGPDAICTQLLRDESGRAHCLGESVAARDARAHADVSVVLGMQLGYGTQLTFDAEKRRRLRAAFTEGSIRNACARCEWANVCTSIAQESYVRARFC